MRVFYEGELFPFSKISGEMSVSIAARLAVGGKKKKRRRGESDIASDGISRARCSTLSHLDAVVIKGTDGDF